MGCAYERSCVVCEDAKVKFRFGKITNVWLSETFVCRVRVLVKDGNSKTPVLWPSCSFLGAVIEQSMQKTRLRDGESVHELCKEENTLDANYVQKLQTQ